MRDNYRDILELAHPHKPVWWDLHGVPRFCHPPEKMLPAMRHIKCQECGRVFWVCLVDCYRNYLGDPMDAQNLVPSEWYYGDPPFHGRGLLGEDDVCYAGYCMSSIPEYEWETYEDEHGLP